MIKHSPSCQTRMNLYSQEGSGFIQGLHYILLFRQEKIRNSLYIHIYSLFCIQS